MKKFLAMLCCLVMAVSFVGCGKGGDEKKDQTAISVNAVTPVYGDSFNLTVGGGNGSGVLVFKKVSGDAATVSAGGAVVCVGIGSVTVSVTKCADEEYNAATSENYTFTVGKKPVTVKAVDCSKSVGDEDPELEYETEENLEGLDSLVGTLVRAEGEELGTYDITQGTLTNENNPKYDITFTGATFTIGDYAKIISVPALKPVSMESAVDLTAILEEIEYENPENSGDASVGIEGVYIGNEKQEVEDFGAFAAEDIFTAYTVKFYIENDYGKVYGNFDIVSDKNIGHFESEENTSAWTFSSSQDNYNPRNQDDAFWSQEFKWQYKGGKAFTDIRKSGKYFLNSGEPNIFSATSPVFTVAADSFISFKMGAARDPENVYVALCDEEGTELERYSNFAFVDPDMALTMIRFFYPVGEHAGKKVYVKIVDNAESGFGFINFDDLWVNLTRQEATAQMTAEKTSAENITAEARPNSISYYDLYVNAIKSYYKNLELFRVDFTAVDNTLIEAEASEAVNLNGYLENITVYGEADYGVVKSIASVSKDGGAAVTEGSFDSYDMSAAGYYAVGVKIKAGEYETVRCFTVISRGDELKEIVNGGFETGDLTGWTVVSGTLKNANPVDDFYGMWGEDMPFNKTGKYLFNGEMAQEEGTNYSLKSTVFTLSGSGWITFKAGGRAAAVKVYKADGTQVAEYANTCFADRDFPNIEAGCRLNTMTTYAANLSEYLGEKLYIEICDVPVEGSWRRAWFDEIVTYYETAPDYANMTDSVLNSNHGDVPDRDYVNIPWVLAENKIS